MNAPPTPPTGRSSSDEPDPTGIRDLLSSLPAPGPMPGDVSARIEAALNAEAAGRGDDRSNVAPLISRSTSADDGATKGSVEGSASRRSRWLRPAACLGIAAAIGVGSLGVYNSMRNEAPGTSEAGPVSPNPTATAASDRITIQNSGRDYTADGLSTQAASMNTSAGQSSSAAASKDGPLATPAGLMTCLYGMGTEILGGGLPEKISADLGTYEGKPAVIVVVTEDGKSRAWVLARTCQSGKGKIAGPTSVA